MSRAIAWYDEGPATVTGTGILVFARGTHHVVGDEPLIAPLVRRRRPDETTALPAHRVGDVIDIGQLQLVGTGLGIARGAPPHDTEGGAQPIAFGEQIRVGVDPSRRMATVGLELEEHNVVRKMVVDPVESLGVIRMEDDLLDVDPLDARFALIVQTGVLADDDVGWGRVVVGTMRRRQDGVGGDERAAAVRTAIFVVDVSHVLVALELRILPAEHTVGAFVTVANVNNVCVCCFTFSSS